MYFSKSICETWFLVPKYYLYVPTYNYDFPFILLSTKICNSMLEIALPSEFLLRIMYVNFREQTVSCDQTLK
jgi:hypothetical protein